MRSIEERVRAALAEEADARTVDVARMRADLEDRLARPRRRSRLLPAAAAAVLLTGGALVAVQVLGGDGPEGAASSGQVDDAFTCPYVARVDLTGERSGFDPDLTDAGPAEVARAHEAPRWEFVVDGDSARLRLGNADGTLGSESRYERDGDEWRLLAAEACSNGSTADPSSETLRLGRHGFDPHPAPRFGADGRPVLVDDRALYAPSGLVTDHRSLYVAPCDGDLCFATSAQDAIGDRMRITRRVQVLGPMCWFFVPDPRVGRATPYALLVAWDGTGRAVDAFRVAGPGHTYEGVRVSDPSWGGGAAWLALVPTPPDDVKLLARLSPRGSTPRVPEAWELHAPVRCGP